MKILCTSARQHLHLHHVNILTYVNTWYISHSSAGKVSRNAQQLRLFFSFASFLQEIETLPGESGFITILLLFFFQVWVIGGRQRLDWAHKKTQNM